jgi:hypothetical protein
VRGWRGPLGKVKIGPATFVGKEVKMRLEVGAKGVVGAGTSRGGVAGRDVRRERVLLVGAGGRGLPSSCDDGSDQLSVVGVAAAGLRVVRGSWGGVQSCVGARDKCRRGDDGEEGGVGRGSLSYFDGGGVLRRTERKSSVSTTGSGRQGADDEGSVGRTRWRCGKTSGFFE